MSTEEKNDIIIWDLDGTLINSQIAMLQKVFEVTGIRFTLADWVYWEFLHEQAMRLTNQTMEEVCSWLNHTSVVCKGVPEVGAQQAILKATNYRLLPVVVTNREEDQREGTLKQIATFFPQIRPGDVYLKPKGMPGIEHKDRIVKKLRPRSVVDDSGDMILGLASRRETLRPFLFLKDKSWNRKIKLPTMFNVVRVGNWEADMGGWATILSVSSRQSA